MLAQVADESILNAFALIPSPVCRLSMPRSSTMECKLCGSPSFRVSRLRFPDISQLVLFRYPVRCRTCYKREFVGFFTALRVRRENKARHQEERRRRMQNASTARQI